MARPRSPRGALRRWSGAVSGKSIGLVNRPAGFALDRLAPRILVAIGGDHDDGHVGHAPGCARGNNSRPLMPGMLMSDRMRMEARESSTVSTTFNRLLGRDCANSIAKRALSGFHAGIAGGTGRRRRARSSTTRMSALMLPSPLWERGSGERGRAVQTGYIGNSLDRLHR